jgi:hypothetical protein
MVLRWYVMVCEGRASVGSGVGLDVLAWGVSESSIDEWRGRVVVKLHIGDERSCGRRCEASVVDWMNRVFGVCLSLVTSGWAEVVQVVRE